jgi:hypothetical protein
MNIMPYVFPYGCLHQKRRIKLYLSKFIQYIQAFGDNFGEIIPTGNIDLPFLTKNGYG